MAFPMPYSMSGSGHQQNLDPQLHMPQMQQTPGMQHGGLLGQQQQQQKLPQRGARGPEDTGMGMQGGMGMGSMQEQNTWASQLSPEDSWSNSSRGMPVAPATLNVEDWCVAFSSFSPFCLFSQTVAATEGMLTIGYRVQFFGMDMGGLNGAGGM